MSESFVTAIGTGVISGILAYVFLIIIVKYYHSSFFPMLVKWVSGGVKIEGKWETRFERTDINEVFKESVTIKQNGHRVRGHIYLIGEANYEYEFEGEFKDLILTAIYWRKKENSRDRGTFTLELIKDGVLEGFYSGYSSSPKDRRVVEAVYKWNQIET